MRFQTILLLLHFISFLYCQAQLVVVNDAESGKPLFQATLSGDNPKAYVVTDVNGKADISVFIDNEVITIRSLGYRTRTSTYPNLLSPFDTIYLEPILLGIGEAVISATRWRQFSRHAPQKIASIGREKILSHQPQTTADLLGSTGAVFIQKSQQGGGSPMIRGFSANRLLYTVDGVRMNNAIFKGGNLHQIVSIDPFAIESAEVLFGPGSLIYGSDAIGGTMAFQTLTPQLGSPGEALVSGSVAGRYSSASCEETGHFDVSAGWERWALTTSISHNNFGHLQMGRYGPDSYLKPWYVQRRNNQDMAVTNENPRLQVPTGYKQLNLLQKLRYSPHKTTDLQYGFHYSETSDFARYDRLTQQRNNLPRFAEWHYGPQVWMMNHLRATVVTEAYLFDELMLSIAHQYFEESRTERVFNRQLRYTGVEKVGAWSANIDARKTISPMINIGYGTEYIVNDVQSTGKGLDIISGTITSQQPRYPDAEWQSAALYATMELRSGQQWSVWGGGRFNHFATVARFDSTFYPLFIRFDRLNYGASTGNLGVVYSPGKRWKASLNFSSAFRAPNVDDIGKVFESEQGSVVVPNTSLRPEYARNIESGIAGLIGQILQVEVTFYHTWLKDAMVRRDFTLNDLNFITYRDSLSRVQAIQNAARARVYGVQAGFELTPFSGFVLATNLNWQHGEEEMDDGQVSSLRHAAPWFGVTRVTFTTGHLTMQFYLVHQGEVPHEKMSLSEKRKTELYVPDREGRLYAPAWYTLNFKARVQVNETLQISAGAENLTDRRYRTYGSGIAAAGRNIIMSVKVDF